MNPVVHESAQAYSGHTVAVAVPKPANLAIGDLWVAQLHIISNGASITLPAGWNVLASIATDYTITVFWKIATGTDVSNAAPSVSFSAQTYAYCATERITGFDPANPFGVPQTDSVGGVFEWTSSKSVTPTEPNSLVLFTYGELGSFNPGMGNSGDTAFGNPEGTITNIQNFAGSAGGFNAGTVVYDDRTTLAPTNGWDINPGSNYADWVAVLVVVNPVPVVAGSGFFALMS